MLSDMKPSANSIGCRPQSRRDFLQTSTVAGLVLTGAPFVMAQADKKTFKVALIGCGGRGCGALENHLEAARWLNTKIGLNLEIQVVATADWFADKARATGKKYGLAVDRCFGGAEGYKKAIALKPDIVLMAQPPVFRPLHFETAVQAGRHVFFEKPVAIDPPGVRRVLQAGELARRKGLCVVAGTQRRHQEDMNIRAREIKDGVYGRIMAGRVACCIGAMFTNTPVNPTTPEHLTGPWQIWVEMSGDHLVEQHVHNLDIANWYLDAHPVSAVGFGFRAQRVAGNMYDFFSVDFEYPQGVHIHSMCRQVANCWNWFGEEFAYEKSKPQNYQPATPDLYDGVGYHKNAYVGEHAHLLYAIVKGRELNETRNVAWASAATILGRESAYRGQQMKWVEMFEDPQANPALYNLQLKPMAEDFETGQITLLKDGAIRIPGRYQPA